MTRYAPPVQLTVKKTHENEMSISMGTERPKPDRAAAEMVARALGSFFDIGSRNLFTAEDGTYAAAVVDREGRRLIVSLLAGEFAFDKDSGVALAEARAWLKGKPRITFMEAENVIEIRAILRGKSLPPECEETTLAVMEEFDLGRDDAEAATNFPPISHEYRREFIRGDDNEV